MGLICQEVFQFEPILKKVDCEIKALGTPPKRETTGAGAYGKF